MEVQDHPAEPPQKSWILKFFNIISATVLLVGWYVSTFKWANQFAHAKISLTLYQSDIIYLNMYFLNCLIGNKSKVLSFLSY